MSETCRKGHVRTVENTYIRSNGWRECRDCARIVQQKRAKGLPRGWRGSPEERFAKRVKPAGDSSGCILWVGGKTRRGYGTFSDGRIHVAHKWAWERLYGAVPEGLELDHLCRNRACVNPDHLEPVTRRENVLRGVSPAAINAFKTHCPNGHPYDLVRPGKRECSVCRREYIRAWKQQRKAAA